MATPVIQTAFVSGELSPSVFGRVDLDRFHVGAATMRNLFVSYRGGAYSRAGTAFVGYSKQTQRSVPPRLIPFQFSINQGLVLEFGNQYMRVISNGAFVTDSAVNITNITNANPAVITVSFSGALTASPNNGAVSSSYAPGDTVTLAGGTFSTPAVLAIDATELIGINVNAAGTGYAPGDTITLGGGTFVTAGVVTVTDTQLVSATINAAGTGGTPGTATLTGTTGTGTKFQVSATIAAGGTISSIDSITRPGDYTANPSSLTAEPVTGGGLTGATLAIGMGALDVSITTAGDYTANPGGGAMTQSATSGSGTGATFDFALFAPLSASVLDSGNYTAFPANPVAQASTSGDGIGVTFTMTSGTTSAFHSGDWAFLSGIGGMTELNGGTFVLLRITDTTYALHDVFSRTIDSTGFSPYTAGGTAARIFTLTMPYSEADLPWLKYTQSADTMTLTCVNQTTLTEYQPIDLKRINDASWTITTVVSNPTVQPPTSTSATIHGGASGALDTFYSYVITSVSPVDGTESIASSSADISGNSIQTAFGTVAVRWAIVDGISQYNVYKAQVSYGTDIPTGALYGYAGTAYGGQFQDTNVVPDFSQVPAQHKDPFARGQIINVIMTSGGSGYTAANFHIASSTGLDAVIEPIITFGKIIGGIVTDPGHNYAPGDTVSISGNGSGATARLTIGPQSGTYPSTCSYFQQRRVFANTLNNPDTYFMSQPGSFRNFDSRIPTIDTDAIIGTPWSVQVNGIQFMLNMPGGLVIMTGLSAWQLVGAGSFSSNVQPITPSSQNAQPEAYNGCSPTVPPIKIDYDIIYVQAKGSIYRSLSYQFYVNVYTGVDITESSSHLFIGYTTREHAWCEEPFKVLWSVRNDGVMLSLTFNKPQQVAGWARHDTAGLFQSVCSITEPPVDALYLAVQRTIAGEPSYMIERMNDRIWTSIENTWCVDCGLTLAQPAPDAILTADSATGLGAIAGATIVDGGTNYSLATAGTIVDDDGQGPGTGALATLTIIGGVITAVTISPQGSGYVRPALILSDPTGTGSGADVELILDNSATFTASAAVFSSANVGSVIRMGGGIAKVTAFTDTQNVVADIISPIVSVIPDGLGTVQPQASGSWTLTAPVTTISSLTHLAGATVTGIADGNEITPRTVAADGTITLDAPASAVTVGLAFQPQLQSVYLDTGSPTIQGQRKKISAVTVRVDSSRGLKVGTNQPDGSTLSPMQLAPAWSDLQDVQDLVPPPYNSAVPPLYTGDVRVMVPSGYAKPGQVCVQQDHPYPMNVLAFIPEVFAGDVPEQKAAPRAQQAKPRAAA